MNIMHPMPHTLGCFVCGEANASGLKLRFETDGKVVRTRFTPGAEHIGFKQTIHGGILSTVLDEIMVWACAVETRRFAYCAELTVRFLNPVRPGEELLVMGELAENRRNKLFEARGEIRNRDGLLLAAGMGKYLPIKPAEVEGMLDDFVGDAAQWFDPKL